MRAVLWDLDGTLLESGRSIRTAMAHVLRERGMAPFTAAELGGAIGKPLRHILHARTEDDAIIEAMTHRYREVYREYAWVFASVPPALRLLHTDISRVARQGVVTTKGEEEAIVLLRDLAIPMDTTVGDDDVRPLKPDPAPVLEACRRLGMDPSSAVMVGDTVYDVEAGVSAGTAAIGVGWGHGTKADIRAAGGQYVADHRSLRAALEQFVGAA